MPKVRKINRLLKLGFIIAIAIILFNILTSAPNSSPQTLDKIRGVWLTHIGNSLLTYSGAIDNVFHRLSLQNFNTVYVDVYNGGTTYPSKYASRNRLISLPLTDPLQTAIKEGKRQGLNIYAWYEHGMMVFPNDKIARQHPDWILTTSDGEQYIEKHLWLDPENTEVKQYFINLFTEAAKKYPELYGIQVDDHWGIPIIFGDKTQAMTELTRQVTLAIRKVRPNLILSLSPNPYQFSLKRYSQDWLRWVTAGLFDELVIQIYRPDSDRVAQSILTSGISEVGNDTKVAVGIFAGGREALKSFDELEKQIDVVERFGYGYSIFSWEYTSRFLRRAIYLYRKIFFINLLQLIAKAPTVLFKT